MKTLLSSAAVGSLVLISLLNGLKADTQTYVGTASGSGSGSAAGSAAGSSVSSGESLEDYPHHYQKRAATTTEPTPPPTNPDAETLTTPPDPQEKPPKPPKFPLPPNMPFPFPRRPGFPMGPGYGGFPQFPFQFPSQSFSPFPYYGYNAFPYSFSPYNQALFQPLPLFDFNTYNQQLQNWIKTAEAQAQQAAANDKDNKDTPSPFGSAAAAQGVYGPQGGFGQTFVYPPPQDGQSITYNRIAPPPPGSNRFGVSTFASSSFSDNNGDKKGTRFSSVSVDDNGNVTTVVSSDPSNNVVAAAPSDASNERSGWGV